MRNPIKSPWPFAYGLFAYAGFAASLVILVSFLFDADYLPVTIDRGPETAPWLAAGIDLLLIVIFGLQHSIMARPGFKRVFTRVVPVEIERSTYVLLSNLVVIALCFLWRPIPGIVWTVDTGILSAIAWGGFALAVVVLFVASFQIDHWELLGLRQTWDALRGRASESPAFAVRGFYRWVRHPIYVGWLMLFWITPTMTLGHLLLAVGMTAYVLVAMIYEERDLLASLGRDYADYRRRVPALLPRLRPSGTARSRQRKSRFGALLLLLALGPVTVTDAGAVPSDRPITALDEITVASGGHERRVKLFEPSAGIRPTRIVVMLHGAGGDAYRIRRFTGFGFEQLADAAGWVVAYPEGIGGTWNDCRSVPAYPAKRLAVDDVAFLATLVDLLRERYGVPRSGVFVAGFSNGGQMSLRLAIERPAAIGSFAVAAAQLPVDRDSVCGTTAPRLSSLWVHGSDDPFLPWAGGPSFGPGGNGLGDVRSVDATREWALEALPGTRAAPLHRLPDRDGDTTTAVERREWQSASGFLLRQYVLRGSGHVLPLRAAPFPDIVGRSARDADFAAIVLDFLTALERATCPPTGSCDRLAATVSR